MLPGELSSTPPHGQTARSVATSPSEPKWPYGYGSMSETRAGGSKRCRSRSHHAQGRDRPRLSISSRGAGPIGVICAKAARIRSRQDRGVRISAVAPGKRVLRFGATKSSTQQSTTIAALDQTGRRLSRASGAAPADGQRITAVRNAGGWLSSAGRGGDYALPIGYIPVMETP